MRIAIGFDDMTPHSTKQAELFGGDRYNLISRPVVTIK
jgi:hypothetical protein